MDHYKIAVCQMNSVDDKEENLKNVSSWIQEAAENGASLIAFPENMTYMGKWYRKQAETIPGPVTDFLCTKAKEHVIWIMSGSFPESTGTTRVHNTLLLIDPHGQIQTTYRKIHLFDVEVTDGPSYQESRSVIPGNEIVTLETDTLGCLGFSICYDLRFGEMYRLMALRGAELIFVPASFTAHTGRMHWETLLKARAIENGVFIVAPDQIGEKYDMTAYGHSMVIDPWGNVIARMDEGTGLIYAEISRNLVRQAQEQIPSLTNRRDDLYQIIYQPNPKI